MSDRSTRTKHEQQALDTLDTLRRKADEHSRELIIIAAAGLLLSMLGVISPSIPWWWPIVPAILIASGLAAYGAAQLIAAMLPDPEGILLVSLRADQDGGEIWELSEDTWEEMKTIGTLYQWSASPRRIYECREYDPQTNVCRANWREAEPASAILENRTPADAMEQVSELRQVYEPEAARARRLLRRVRGIVRRLDQERTRARAQQLDQATGLDSIDSPSIAEILDEELPEDIHPEAREARQVDTEEHRDERQFELHQDEYDAILDEDEPIMRGL